MREIGRGLTWLLTTMVRGYQLIVSPWFAPTCRYYPSCSNYAITALRVHGPIRGVGLAAWRVLRCNPWSAGGVDHVPPRRGHAHPAADSAVDAEGRTLVARPAGRGSTASPNVENC